jgi:hypothetical protein
MLPSTSLLPALSFIADDSETAETTDDIIEADG